MRHGQIELDWADGTYPFRLSISGIEELEEKTDASLFQIAARLHDRVATIRQIREVLRIALIGGGMEPVPALRLVERYIDERPVDENRDTALAVVLAGLARVNGLQESPPGEVGAAGVEGPTSPPSTEAEASSA